MNNKIFDIKLLDEYIKYRTCSVDNPYNGMDYQLISWNDVEFIKDFYPWKKGDKVITLIFSPHYCGLKSLNNWDEVVNTCEVKLVPKYSKISRFFEKIRAYTANEEPRW